MEIVFNDVSYSLRENTPLIKEVLSHVSFSLTSGNIYGFLGNSGSGKTFIAELISALCLPSNGEVSINGTALTKKIRNINELRCNIGYVFKNVDDMFLTNSVKKELVFGMKYYKYKVDLINKRVKDALKLVGLSEDYLNKKISDLTLSEKKRISLACVLVYNPKVIIMDEITIGMNAREKKDLIRMIKLLKNKYNKIVILLTKDTDFLYKVCNYVYVMNEGSIVKEGNTDILEDKELLDEYDLYYPLCLEFVTLANSRKNANLEYYKDVKDLIKGVYRSVF